MAIEKRHIETAVKNPDVFIKIPELIGAIAKKRNDGSLFKYVGGFNMVFQLEHQKRKWAFRVCFLPKGENKERYRKISKYLSKQRLSYFADFIYDEKGILVNGNLIDTIRMEWLEGKLLKEYIESNLLNNIKLIKLANDFLEMFKTLRENKISHGDLQEGNILVDSFENLKLVDYDSICIPELEGAAELVTGLKGYQHPSRFKQGRASLKADYFSELVIYLSILALSENPNLWSKYQVKDTQYLLFTETDFADIKYSEIYKDLQNLSGSVKILMNILVRYLEESNYLNLSAFENYLSPPKIINFKSNFNEIFQGESIELSWVVENSDVTQLDNNIGSLVAMDSLVVSPTYSVVYRLNCKNKFGQAEREINVKVLQRPKIKVFQSKKQNIEFEKDTELFWDIENVAKVELHWLGNMDVVDQKGEKKIASLEDTTFKIVATALDGIAKEEKEVTVRVFKKVEIKSFISDLEFALESLPIKLKWEIENASIITLCSNTEADVDVSGTNEIEIYLKKTSTLYLKAKNDLFSSNSEQLKVEVQHIPTFSPSIIPRLPVGNELIPSFNLDFKELSDSVLSDSQLRFQKVMKTKRRFSLYDSLCIMLNLKKS